MSCGDPPVCPACGKRLSPAWTYSITAPPTHSAQEIADACVRAVGAASGTATAGTRQICKPWVWRVYLILAGATAIGYVVVMAGAVLSGMN